MGIFGYWKEILGLKGECLCEMREEGVIYFNLSCFPRCYRSPRSILVGVKIDLALVLNPLPFN